MAKGKKAEKVEKAASVARSKKAGLTFPVGRVHRFLKQGHFADRIGAGAPVFLAAVLEYLTAELLETAGLVAKDAKRSRITPHHIQLAVNKDDDLAALLKGIVIVDGGVIPHIPKSLLEKKQKKKRKAKK